MTHLHLPPMLWSSDAAWADLARRPPSLATLVIGIALPAALLPPALLLHAAEAGSARYLPALPPAAWQLVAAALFFGQIAGLATIQWLIGAVARSRGGTADRRATLTLATIALLPLWLSSLVLLRDGTLAAVAMPVLATGAAVALLRRGAQCVLQVRDDFEALELGVIAIHGGIFAWGAVMATILVPTLSGH